MNKTDTLLWLMRAHEAIRKLPEDANINSVDICLYGDGNRIKLFLDDDHKFQNIVSRNVCKYSDGQFGRVEISDSNGIDYWWGVYFDDDGNIKARA